MQRCTKAMTDSLVGGRDVKGAACSNRHAPGVGPDLRSLGHDCSHHIPSLKPFDFFHSFGFRTGKAPFIHQAHLTAAMSLCRDKQRHDTLDQQALRGTGTDTGRIQPMGFLQATTYPIELGTSTRSYLDRQAHPL
mgnify:CR=1 FL=1